MHAADLNQSITELEIATSGEGMIDFSARVEQWLSHIGAGDGMLTIFIRHTSASLTIQENADPDVQADLVDALGKLAPSDRRYRHGMEGPDDMPAHIKASLVGFSISIPITNHQFNLGTWQGIYLCEFRNRGGSRRLVGTIYS